MRQVRYSPDGRYLAASSMGSSHLSIFGAGSWDTKRELKISDVFKYEPHDDVYVETGQPRRTFRGYADYLTNLCWSSDSRFIYSSATDGKICRWAADSGRPPASTEPFLFAQGEGRSCSSMDLSPDGTLVAANRTPAQIMLWELADRSFGVLTAGEEGLRKVAFTPDGKSLIVAYSTRKELGRCWLKEVNFWQKQ